MQVRGQAGPPALDNGLGPDLGAQKLPKRLHAGLDVLGGLDWSGKNRRGKALTLVARQRATGKITPIYHQRIKGTLSDVVALFGKLWQVGVRWQFMLLEDNGVQVELNEVIRAGAPAQWRHTIKDFKTLPGAKLDPVRGLSVIGTMLETGGFLWPAGATSVSGDWAMLEAELTDTTIEQVSTPGKTPDGLMSLWFPMHHLTQTPAAASKEPLRPVPASPSAGRHGGY